MSLLGRFGIFIREQSKNFKVLLVRGILAQFLTQLAQNFNNLYIVYLGATPFQMSTVQSVGSAVNAIISIPAGWLSDMYSLKRILILGMIVETLSVIFYAFAQSWIWIILAILFATLTMTLVFRAENIFIVNSLADHNRATGYGLRTAITQACSIFAPTVGGILVFYFGGISVEGIRPLYFIQLIGFTAIGIYVALKIEDVETEKHAQSRDLLRHYKEMFKAGESLKRFTFVLALGSITVMMSTPFYFLYAVEFKGADSLTIGYMGTCMVLVSMFLAIPVGSLADRRGRKLTYLVFWSSFYCGSSLLFVFAPRGAYWLLLLAWCMRGVMMSNSASWMAWTVEIVPRKYRGRWTGFIGLFQGLLSVPAMLFGGYLYESVDPALVFLIPVAVEALLRAPMLATIPETLRRKD